METTHRPIVGDSRDMDAVDDGTVDLVVTSPPYPMIEMWDPAFAALNPAIEDRLDAGRGRAAFDLMHEELARTWREVDRVLADGGIVCVNVGDATRSVDGEFQLYPNHAAILEWFRAHGYRALPDILWRKPVNSAAKFMGSGMLPPNAYVTLEHEYVLVFRNGGPRSFEPESDRRYRSAYFWEERNRWFSDVWTDVRGRIQALDGDGRDRSGAFPFAIPFRLINMFSVYGDTVLDPFWGTGTTSIAAMVAARDSIGYEIEPELAEAFEDQVDDVPTLSERVCRDRLARHREFLTTREERPGYTAESLGVPVVTSQERRMELFTVGAIDRRKDGEAGPDAIVASHDPFDGD